MGGFGFIAWIIIGIVAGWLAEKIMKRDHGLLTNLIVGVVGALIGLLDLHPAHLQRLAHALAGAQVAHGAVGHGQDAAEADAHAAAARHEDAGVLGGVEEPLDAAARVAGFFGPGPVVVGQERGRQRPLGHRLDVVPVPAELPRDTAHRA